MAPSQTNDCRLRHDLVAASVIECPFGRTRYRGTARSPRVQTRPQESPETHRIQEIGPADIASVDHVSRQVEPGRSKPHQSAGSAGPRWRPKTLNGRSVTPGRPARSWSDLRTIRSARAELAPRFESGKAAKSMDCESAALPQRASAVVRCKRRIDTSLSFGVVRKASPETDRRSGRPRSWPDSSRDADASL